MSASETLRNYIGGAWIEASSPETIPVENPATGQTLAYMPLSGESDVDRAVTVAREALWSWRRVPVVQRVRCLFRFKNLLEKNFEELARVVTIDNGKTLDEARVSVRRGIENVEHACAMPSLMKGSALEDAQAGIDCETFRQPVGVFAAITPVCFPAMVPLWFWPYAVATGNTFILKPSERAPLCQTTLFELAHEAGFPAGVVNLVHGDRSAGRALVDHPGVAGISFVGTSSAAEEVYREAAARGKRVQAFGGAHNYSVVMPDADLDRTVDVLIDGSFGCSGQRCLAGSVVLAVGDIHQPLRQRLIEAARRIQVGSGLEPGIDMGPVSSGQYLDRLLSLLHVGESEGARIALDGRGRTVEGYPGGYFLGPTIVEDVAPDSTLAQQEIFGPVMILGQVGSMDEAMRRIHGAARGGSAAIFTSNGRYAREFRHQVGLGMVGVNVGMAQPMAFFPFGGSKGSFYGDLKAHGDDAIRFFTDTKVVVSRWF